MMAKYLPRRRHCVHALQHVEERDLVAIVVVGVVVHHSLGKVLHGGLGIDGEVTKTDVGAGIVA